MELKELLVQKRPPILDRWFEHILKSYPADTSNFMRREKDRFLNPVGYSIRSDIEVLFDLIVEGVIDDSSIRFPGNLIRVMAVQDFSPSTAVGFIFQLKTAIDDTIGMDELSKGRSLINSRIDKLALMAFDEYMACREKVFQIRVGEIQRTVTGKR
jgi:hypothetical protein